MTIFTRLAPPASPPDGPPLWAVFRRDELLTPMAGPALLADLAEVPVSETILIGALDQRPVYAALVPDDFVLPDGWAGHGLRELLAHGDEDLWQIADYAVQLLRWQQHSQFCGGCGQAIALADGWGKRCSQCSHIVYPPVSPAIIVLIHDDQGRALLTTKTGWGARYSLVAGFVEPGESFEDCVAREVLEEVGVTLKRMRYIKSQSWPFPHQIMVGFLAEYAAGEIVIDASELADARWFTLDALPELPQSYTISRQILEAWRAGERA